MPFVLLIVAIFLIATKRNTVNYPVIPGTSSHPSTYNEEDYLTQVSPINAQPGMYDGGNFMTSWLYKPGQVTPFTKPTAYKYH